MPLPLVGIGTYKLITCQMQTRDTFPLGGPYRYKCQESPSVHYLNHTIASHSALRNFAFITFKFAAFYFYFIKENVRKRSKS